MAGWQSQCRTLWVSGPSSAGDSKVPGHSGCTDLLLLRAETAATGSRLGVPLPEVACPQGEHLHAMKSRGTDVHLLCFPSSQKGVS